jgi:hypothetical protein
VSIVSFPNQRPLPAAACQRNDAGRPDGASLHCPGIYSQSSGAAQPPAMSLTRDGDNRSAVPGQATVANHSGMLTGERQPLAGCNAGRLGLRRIARLVGVPRCGLQPRPQEPRPARAIFSAPNARHVTAPSSDAHVCFAVPTRRPVSAGRGHLSRPALAAAICVSWTIALVAGVVLIGELV